ncbi:MAG: Stk1 family PASTA domain-containing Ser/Thr kinase [Actinomycetota bacterium]|nr:Stk1 family PASTA domain-containing Ser/Thr kinase [Actinomycetota bacterium]
MIGRMLDGRYRIDERIARGGMATVYTAVDTRLDRQVAVKVMHEGLGADEDFADRFVREARASARLNHPGVVAVFDQGEDEGTVYLVMEYVPGATLRDVIRKEAPLPPARALAVMEQVLQALGAAHQAGLVHRDVKPENVLIAPTGQVKVADFGLARAVTSTTAATATAGVLIGTVSYVAPELVLHQGTDARSDVYACGVLLFELLTGRKPHEAETPIQVAYKHVHEDVPAASSLQPGIPAYLDALVARATARDRDLRPTDAKLMLQQTRRVAIALAQGVAEDPELVADLSPTASSRDEPTVAEPWDILVFEDQQATDDRAAHPGEHTAVTAMTGSGPPVPRPGPSTRPSKAPARGRRGVLLLVLVLLLAAGAAVAGWQLGVGRYTDVPQVTGLSLTEAKAAAADAGLSVTVAYERFDEAVAPDHVISSSPEAGGSVLEGGSIEVAVSLGKERSRVPDVVGLPLAEAEAEIRAANLTSAEPIERFNGRYDAGVVMDIDVTSGRMVGPDVEIGLTVSKGRLPIDIPDTTGRTRAAAERLLGEARLDVLVDEAYDDTVPLGRVVSQDPGGGTGFKNDEVSIVVSLGPETVEVPDVIASGVDSATDELEALGFVVQTQDSDQYLGLGYVLEQSVPPGDTAPYGSTITLTLV